MYVGYGSEAVRLTLFLHIPSLFETQPEVGGIVCRLPLEAEIYRNFKHSLIGKKLRKSALQESTREWYKSAQALVEKEMLDIAENAQGGQIDASTLDEEAAEMLQLYIDNQVRIVATFKCACRRFTHVAC